MNHAQNQFFLKETLKLAKKGMGWTYPNPIVGALIVKGRKIIASGYHKKFGSLHAEAEALKKAKERAHGATLYLNLEPCCYFGKTAPCTDAIIQAGITRVVCSTIDPNPKVCGRGITTLKKAGIDVVVGVLEKEARQLNEAFFTFHEKRRPFIALKFASSLDGKIATRIGDSKWITNEKARKFARELRSQYQAVLVGVNTVTRDNPHLGVRINGGKDPLRIILDPYLRIPITSQVLRNNNVLIVTTSQASKNKLDLLKHNNITTLRLSDCEIPLQKLLAYLKEKEIISLLVEGGSKTLGYFVDEKLFDKVYAFYSPIIIGGEKAVSVAGGVGSDLIGESIYLKNTSIKKLDDNFLLIGYQ